MNPAAPVTRTVFPFNSILVFMVASRETLTGAAVGAASREMKDICYYSIIVSEKVKRRPGGKIIAEEG